MSIKSNMITKGNYSSYLNGKFHEFIGLEKSIDGIKDSINETLEYAARMEDRNKELLDEKWKDTQLQEMKEQYDRMKADYWRGFPISEEEEKKIIEWKDNHNNKRHKGNGLRGGAIGGSWKYSFVPTSIGTSGVVCCQYCRAKMLRELGDKLEYDSYGDYKKKSDELMAEYDCEFEFHEIG